MNLDEHQPSASSLATSIAGLGNFYYASCLARNQLACIVLLSCRQGKEMRRRRQLFRHLIRQLVWLQWQRSWHCPITKRRLMRLIAIPSNAFLTIETGSKRLLNSGSQTTQITRQASCCAANSTTKGKQKSISHLYPGSTIQYSRPTCASELHECK